MPRYLVVSATKAEAAYLPADLPLVITGMGKVAAATATAAALAGYDDLGGLTAINLGTAGALKDGLDGLHLPSVVLNHDLDADALRALGYDPRDRLELGGDGPVLATGDAFVTDPIRRAALAERADLVDMEGYAVAYAAQRAGVPVRLVKHVSDNADSAALDWPSLVDASARVLGDWATDNLA
ncbi:nucleosidase [Nocardioides speluncae]|uniref:nucleosidase n=1 Tax=Nocardioides speluncae TaxID=2670337 RepID=UPI000D68BE16|nr:nucleosidase [Nocardioides speluncae]